MATDYQNPAYLPFSMSNEVLDPPSSHLQESSKVIRPIPFSCCYCDQPLKRKGDLSRHMKKHTNEEHFCCVYQDCHWNGTFYRRDKLVDHVISQHKETRESAKQFVKISTPNSRPDVKSLGNIGRRGKDESSLANHRSSHYLDDNEVESRRPAHGIENWADVDTQAVYSQRPVLVDAHYYGGQGRILQIDGPVAVSAPTEVNWNGLSRAGIDTQGNSRLTPESMIPSGGYSTSMLNEDGSLQYGCSSGLEDFGFGLYSKSIPVTAMRRRGTRWQ